MSDSRFTWGDAVRVKATAPASVRPGERGDVVAVTEIVTQEMSDLYDAAVGSTVYQVEFGDGNTEEVGDVWLEVAAEECDTN